jgi:hypothetical protein
LCHASKHESLLGISFGLILVQNLMRSNSSCIDDLLWL